METLDFSGETIRVTNKSGFRYDKLPMLSYAPVVYDRLADAYNRRDWREMNRLGARWWDPYGERWHKFGPNFWDA
jgi:hypothetical protein